MARSVQSYMSATACSSGYRDEREHDDGQQQYEQDRS